MPTIRPMADLRDTSKISELCYEKDEPVFITKNGSGHLVVMSMHTYDKQMGLLDVYRKLGAAEKQLEDKAPLLEGAFRKAIIGGNIFPPSTRRPVT